jgi:hypothetical protein
VQGVVCFQSGLYHASGAKRLGWFALGALVLVGYSLFASKVDFGKLLGIYVVLFFLVAQIVTAISSTSRSPAPSTLVALIVLGGLIMSFWKA